MEINVKESGENAMLNLMIFRAFVNLVVKKKMKNNGE